MLYCFLQTALAVVGPIDIYSPACLPLLLKYGSSAKGYAINWNSVCSASNHTVDYVYSIWDAACYMPHMHERYQLRSNLTYWLKCQSLPCPLNSIVQLPSALWLKPARAWCKVSVAMAFVEFPTLRKIMWRQTRFVNGTTSTVKRVMFNAAK